MDVIVWLMVGLVAGAIARLLLPGRDPMGLLGAVVALIACRATVSDRAA